MPSTPHINCHAHCFTLSHVPENFFHELLPKPVIHSLDISKLLRSKGRRKFVQLITGNIIRGFVKWFSPGIASQLGRLHGLLKYAAIPQQEQLIDTLYYDYNKQYRLVLLSMDMDYMNAGVPAQTFLQQLIQLKNIKADMK